MPMTRLLHVLIILLTTFSQTRNLPGNRVHDFADDIFVTNLVAPFCDVSGGISLFLDWS